MCFTFHLSLTHWGQYHGTISTSLSFFSVSLFEWPVLSVCSVFLIEWILEVNRIGLLNHSFWKRFCIFFSEWKGEQSEHPFKSHYTVTMPISLSLSQFFSLITAYSLYWMESTWTWVSVLFSDLPFTEMTFPSFFIFLFIHL